MQQQDNYQEEPNNFDEDMDHNNQPYLPQDNYDHNNNNEDQQLYDQNEVNNNNNHENNFKQDSQNNLQQQNNNQNYQNGVADHQYDEQQFENNNHNNNNENNLQQQQDNQEFQEDLDPEDVPVEIQQYDQNKKDMYMYMSMGFDKKFRDLHPKMPQYAQNDFNAVQQHLNEGGPTPLPGQANGIQQFANQKQFETLDAKAYLITPPKALGYYQTKGEINFYHKDDLEKGRPIQMISIDPETNKWCLSDQANQELMKVKGPISFVSIVGQPKSGKTFLMNHLLKISEHDKFKQGDSQDNNTKGIIMYSEPTYNPQTNSYLFFLDTQEFDMTQEGRQQRETLQFFITMLLSQTMMINVNGDLNDASLQPLQDLSLLSNYIQVENMEEKDELANIFPRIIYLLRNHKHIIQEKGVTVAMHTYLDNFIFSDERYKKVSQTEQKIRRRIVKYFRSRDAFSMVDPVEPGHEDKYERLDNLVQDDLAPNFQEELRALRKKIVYHAKKKEIRGVFLSPTMTVSFINSILEDINNEQRISVDKAFAILIENEFIYTYNYAIEEYNESLGRAFVGVEYKNFYDIHNLLRTAREECFNIFYSLKAHDTVDAEKFFDEYFQKLVNFIQQRETDIINFNNEKLKKQVDQEIAQTKQVVLAQNKNDTFSVDDLRNITLSYQELLQKVLAETQGGKVEDDPLIKAVRTIQGDLTDQFLNELSQNTSISDKKLEQLRNDANKKAGDLNNKVWNQEEENKKKQNEINSLTNKIQQQNKDYQNLEKKSQMDIQNLKKAHQKEVDEFKKALKKAEEDIRISKAKEKKCF